MSSMLLTPPAAEPLTLTEAKDYLRVDHDDDDGIIAALVTAARGQVEAQTRRALVAQTWRLVRDAWPADGRIAALPVPLIEVAAARVYDDAGVAQPIDPVAFVIDAAAAPAIIAVPPWAVPAPGRTVGGIEIDIAVGYGATGADVPAPLRQAVRLLLAHWYENRGLVALGESVAVLPASVAALLAPFRVLSL